MDDFNWRVVDETLADYLLAHSDIRDRWLLEQTIYTGSSRRAMYRQMPLQAAADVLDIGSGFGALAIDLACLPFDLHVRGIDYDEEKIVVARELAAGIRNKGGYRLEGIPQFDRGDVYAMPYAGDSFDVVIARFVLQHLTDATSAIEEMKRVLRPGGYIILIDIDENMTVTHPESSAFVDLHSAFNRLQQVRGGDRTVGRKLSTFLQRADFAQVTASAQVLSQHSFIQPGDPALLFAVRRFLSVRDDLVSEGIMSEQDFDLCLDAYAKETNRWEFHSSAQVLAVGRKQAR